MIRRQPIVRRGVHGARTLFGFLLRYRHDIILEADLTSRPDRTEPASDLRIKEYREFDSDVSRIYGDLERPYAAERIRAQMQDRFRIGLRFFALHDEATALASTWISPGAGRCFEEYALRVRVPPRHLWLIDIYVARRARGRRLFSYLLEALVRTRFPDSPVMWSDVGAENEPSLAAHRAHGFAPVGEADSLHLAERVMLRRWSMPEPLRPVDYALPHRLVYTGRAYRDFLARYE